MRGRRCKHYNYKSKRKIKKLPICLILIIVTLALLIANINNILAYFIDTDTSVNEISIITDYTIFYDANSGTGTMLSQPASYNEETQLTANAFSKAGYMFNGWNTKSDGTGTEYTDRQVVINMPLNGEDNVTLYAQWIEGDWAAEINGTYYSTLQAAINSVTEDNTETTIKVLKDIQEVITVQKNKNIVFNLQNYTLSNLNNNAVITNNGTIKINNGTITASQNHGAINNNSTGRVIISGGRIIATGDRQAVYNDKGYVEVSGDAYLSAQTGSTRGTLQNQSGGTLLVTGGTIISTTQQAVLNSGTMTIGVNDGNVNTSTPVIQGATYGVSSSTNFKFYDGIVKGKTNGFNNETKIEDKEAEYNVVHSTESINGEEYKTAFLAISKVVTFDANGGTVGETTKAVLAGNTVGTLPTPNRAGYSFDGWFTLPEGGTQVYADTVVTDSITYYAHWTEIVAAEINGTTYKTIAEAVEAVPTDNTETVIKVLSNVSENITVSSGKNIIFDLQNHTITNVGNKTIFANSGTMYIKNGTLESNADAYADIDNKTGGTVYIESMRIIATGGRQAVYNEKGYIEIKGNSYMSSSAPERPAIQNIAQGRMKIISATVVSTTQQAVDNTGEMTIGVKDGIINSNSPTFQGTTYGVTNTGTFNFYDGTIKGVTGAINGNVTEIETNSTQIDDEEVINGVIYQTTHLALQ